MPQIRQIWKRSELFDLARQLGVRPNWHEPDEQDVTARAFGTGFDNAGFSTFEDLARMSPDGSEMFIALYKQGEIVATVNVAMLFAWATGWSD